MLQDSDMVTRLASLAFTVDAGKKSRGQQKPYYLDIILRLDERQVDSLVRGFLHQQGLVSVPALGDMDLQCECEDDSKEVTKTKLDTPY